MLDYVPFLGLVNAKPVTSGLAVSTMALDLQTPAVWFCTATGSPDTWLNVLGSGGPPTGSAGGGLGGDYPDPAVVSGEDGFTVDGALNVAGVATVDDNIKAEKLVIYEGADGVSGPDSSNSFGLTTPIVDSGLAFTPQAVVDSMAFFEFSTTDAGAVGITMGPTGDEHAVVTAATLAASTDTVIPVRVPAGFQVVVTWTGTSTLATTVIYPS